MKHLGPILFGGLCAAGLLLFPQQSAAGAAAGMATCLSTLVPSLFPFLFLTTFLVRCGAVARLGHHCRWLGRLFRLPAEAVPALFLGMVGGYPAGSRAVEELYTAGLLSEKEAARMLLCCVHAGPAFLYSAVGCGFLGNPRAGAVLLSTHLLAGFFLGLLLGRCAPPAAKAVSARQSAAEPAGAALLHAVRKSGSAMLLMCALVILCSALLGVLARLPLGPLGFLLAAGSEVTLSCQMLSALHAPLWMLALVLGWGGVCVHLQCLEGLSFPVKYRTFALCRALHGGLAAVLTLPFTNWAAPPLLPGDAVQVLGSLQKSVPALSSSAAASMALLLLCGVCLLEERLPAGSAARRRAEKRPGKRLSIDKNRSGKSGGRVL